jgi:hypothetical protein
VVSPDNNALEVLLDRHQVLFCLHSIDKLAPILFAIQLSKEGHSEISSE